MELVALYKRVIGLDIHQARRLGCKAQHHPVKNVAYPLFFPARAKAKGKTRPRPRISHISHYY